MTKKTEVLDMLKNYPTLSGLAAWLSSDQNWLVATAFEYQAEAAWAMGYKRYSARTIIEYLRHHTAISDRGPVFKIDNNIAPMLAQMHIFLHPERIGFFETRKKDTN